MKVKLFEMLNSAGNISNKAALNLNVSMSTITRFLREDHECVPMKKKPALTETNKINRRVYS